MFCRISQRKFSEFSSSLERAVMRDRVPYMGAFELTYRCNQACCHCYCNLGVNDRRRSDELTTAQIQRILDEMAASGCLWLLLTGGEVLLREDFPAIYLHALKAGMIVEVFTNATLIDDRTAALFAEFPPFGVGVTIYGSHRLPHDTITGVAGSFQKTMDGISQLKKNRVKFSLKTILMTLNYPDLKAMRALAGELGARFFFDTLISPRTDGSVAPAQYRLDVDRMVGLDIDEEQDFKDCEDVFGNFWKKSFEEALNCGAGAFAFNINPYGVLSPCTMFSSFQYPLRASSFGDAWKKMVVEYGNRQNDFIPDECRSCSMLLMCSRCAAWAETETGSVSKKVDYLCEYAKCLEKKFIEKKGRVTDGKKVLQKA